LVLLFLQLIANPLSCGEKEEQRERKHKLIKETQEFVMKRDYT